MIRTLLAAAGAAVAAAALLPASAGAHALLEATTPERGARLERAPAQVSLRFSEPVEAEFGSVRVFDSRGREVQQGRAFHPSGRGAEVAVRLRGGLADDGYTVTYRVISADSHPVSGGFAFVAGDGVAPATPVADLLGDDRAGPVTGVAFGAARAVQFGAIAAALGALIFLLACWLPGLGAVAGRDEAWASASAAFAGRLRAFVIVAAAAGAVSGALAIVLQGAVAGGTPAWDALSVSVVGDVLATRFGVVWGVGVLAWLVVAALALPGPVPALALGLPLAALAFLPAIGGHAGVQSPVAVLLPANVLHVVAMSAWLGGIAVLVLVLRAATARLEPDDRMRLLAAVVGRFSLLAGIAVAVLLASGVAQGLVEVRTVPNLVETAFGRAVLVKAILFAGIVALGWVNRRRLLPALSRTDDATARRRPAAAHAARGAADRCRRARRHRRPRRLRPVDRRGDRTLVDQRRPRPGAARADRRSRPRRPERDPRLPLRPRVGTPVRRHEGAHRHRRAARAPDRADRPRADQGRTRPLRDLGRSVRRHRGLDARDRRSRVGLRRAPREGRRADRPMISSADRGHDNGVRRLMTVYAGRRCSGRTSLPAVPDRACGRLRGGSGRDRGQRARALPDAAVPDRRAAALRRLHPRGAHRRVLARTGAAWRLRCDAEHWLLLGVPHPPRLRAGRLRCPRSSRAARAGRLMRVGRQAHPSLPTDSPRRSIHAFPDALAACRRGPLRHAALGLLAAASAHASLLPSSAPAGGFTRLDVRVPNERDESATTRSTSSCRTASSSSRTSRDGLDCQRPGRRRGRVADHVEGDGRRGAIAPGQFRDFGLSTKMPNGNRARRSRSRRSRPTATARSCAGSGRRMPTSRRRSSCSPSRRVRLLVPAPGSPPCRGVSDDGDMDGLEHRSALIVGALASLRAAAQAIRAGALASRRDGAGPATPAAVAALATAGARGGTRGA